MVRDGVKGRGWVSERETYCHKSAFRCLRLEVTIARPLNLALPLLAVEATISFAGAYPEAYACHCVLGSYLETLHCLEKPQEYKRLQNQK